MGDAVYVAGRVRFVVNVELLLLPPPPLLETVPNTVKFPELSRDMIDVPEVLLIQNGVISSALF